MKLKLLHRYRVFASADKNSEAFTDRDCEKLMQIFEAAALTFHDSIILVYRLLIIKPANLGSVHFQLERTSPRELIERSVQYCGRVAG